MRMRPWQTVVHLKSRLLSAFHEENVFLFLLFVRWLSLLPPALSLAINPTPDVTARFIFALALLNNLLLTVFQAPLNRLVARYPLFIGVDMAVAAALIGFTGGTSSPYSLYARTPLLAAAFFFQIRGGLLAAAAFTPIYLLALEVAQRWSGAEAGNGQEALGEISRFFLMALIFGYPSLLLERLRAATAQLQEAQQQALRAETLAAAGRLVAKVSHEIRNPLCTIGGFARSMLRHPDDVERVCNHSRIIAEEVQRLEQLLTDMLDLTRPPRLARRPENLHDILDKAWLLSGGAMSGTNLVSVRKDYAADLPVIEVDAPSLLRAFLNVMRNGIQHMPEGGMLTIATRFRRDDGGCHEVEVTIADTGPGIPPDVLPTLFTPFVTHRAEGTGLGLAVTQDIVRQHGGRIEVQSEAGHGARFRFFLPLQPVVDSRS